MTRRRNRRFPEELSSTHLQRLLFDLDQPCQINGKSKAPSKVDSLSPRTSADSIEEKELPPSDSTLPSASESSELSLPYSFQNYELRPAEFAWTVSQETPSSKCVGAGDILRRFYEVQVKKLSIQMEATKRNMEMVRMEANDQQERHNLSVAKLESKLELAIEENDQQKRTIKNLENKLDLDFAQFSLCEISEAFAAELKRKKEAGNLSMRDHLQLQLHEYLKAARLQMEIMQSENLTLNRKVQELEEEQIASRRAESKQSDKVKELQMQLEHQIETAKVTRSCLQEKVSSLRSKLEKYKATSHEIKSLAELEHVRNERDRLRDVASDQEANITDLNSEVTRLNHEVRMLQETMMLVQDDKKYLENAKSSLEEKEFMWKEEVEKLKDRIQQLEAQKIQVESVCNQRQEELRHNFDIKMSSEIKKWAEMSEKEADNMKNEGQSACIREIEILKASRNSDLQQLQCAEKKIEALQSMLNDKVAEASSKEHRDAKSIFTLRNDLMASQLKLKENEEILEHKKDKLRFAILEIEMLQKKLKVHHEEFVRLECACREKIAGLETELNECQMRLREFSYLDRELKEAAVVTVDTAELEDAIQNDCKGKKPIRSVYHRLPEYMSLIQELATLKKAATHTQQLLAESRKQCQYQEEQCETYKRQLEALRQPQHFMIEKLRHFEIETQGYQERLKEKEVIVANMERSLRILQEKLQGINSNREELTMLKSKVQHMQHHMLSARDVADTPNCAYRAKDSKKMTNQESFNKIPQWYSQLRASNA